MPSTQPKIYVHLGLRKTGTTFLQKTLHNNAEDLISKGWLYPKTGRNWNENVNKTGRCSGHSNLRTALKKPDSSRGRAALESLRHEIQQNDVENVIISSELFLPIQESDEWLDFSSLSRLGKIVPIVYLRRQDRLLESIYMEFLGHARKRITIPFPRFVRRYGDFLGNFEDLLSQLLNQFDKSEMFVRSYDDAKASTGLLGDFEEITNLPPLVTDQSAVDLSFNPAIANVLRAINERDDLSAKSKRKIFFEIGSDKKWRANHEESGARLCTKSDYQELADKYREMNNRLVRDYVSGPGTMLMFPDKNTVFQSIEQRYPMPKARRLAKRKWDEEIAVPPVLPTLSRQDHPNRYRVAIASLQRQTDAEILEFITWHKTVGIDKVEIFFDNSDTPINSDIAALPGVSITHCNDAYWAKLLGNGPWALEEKQRAVMKIAHRTLSDEGFDWVGFIDGDELIYGNIGDIFSNAKPGVDVIQLDPAEAVLHEEMNVDSLFGARWFKRLPHDSPRGTEAVYQALPQLKKLTLRGFFGHIKGKYFLRGGAEVDYYSLHHPVNFFGKLTYARTADALVLHFDAPTYPAWLRKWETRASSSTIAENMSPRRLRQFESIKRLIENRDEEGLRNLHRDWYFVPTGTLVRMRDEGLASYFPLLDRALGNELSGGKGGDGPAS